MGKIIREISADSSLRALTMRKERKKEGQRRGSKGGGRKTEKRKKGTGESKTGKWCSLHVFLLSDTGYEKYVQNK